MDVNGLVAEAIMTDRVVEIARAMCAVPSPRGEEAALASVVIQILDRPHIELHVEDVVAGRPNVIATVRGSGKRAPLVLNGHMDTSVHPGPWSRNPHDPWVERGRLFGGGITDMKGGLAAMVAAIEAASQIRTLPGDLILHAVMHHDTIGLGTKYALASEGPAEGFGICGEPSSLAIQTANGGAVKFEVALHGQTAHVSRLEEGTDALEAAITFYRVLSETDLDYVPHPRLPDLPIMVIGQLEAGSGPSGVPDRALIRGDIRTVPGMDRATVLRQLKKIAEETASPGITSRVRVTAAQKPFLGASSGYLVDSIAHAHSAIRGNAPVITSALPCAAFVTDAADMAAAGLDTVVYGPGDWHFRPDESVDIEELADAARVYLATSILLRQPSQAS